MAYSSATTVKRKPQEKGHMLERNSWEICKSFGVNRKKCQRTSNERTPMIITLRTQNDVLVGYSIFTINFVDSKRVDGVSVIEPISTGRDDNRMGVCWVTLGGSSCCRNCRTIRDRLQEHRKEEQPEKGPHVGSNHFRSDEMSKDLVVVGLLWRLVSTQQQETEKGKGIL